MRFQPVFRVVSTALVALMLGPSAASAQTAEIAGVVRDTSGGVLPGVTVEASSPALIEKFRSVVTDSQGQYRIIDLRPGGYTVVFSLTGFSTVRRQGIVLTPAFTATVNAEMQVGAVEETITVSGASPLVDVQTVTQRRALTAELIDELPTGRSFQNLAVLVPGVQVPLSQQDVGGADGARWQTMSVHGSRDDQMPLTLNGMPFNNMNNTGGGYNHTLSINTGTVQEMTVTTSGQTAEARTSGVLSNTIPKEGSNQFRYYLYGNFTNGALQSGNLSPEIIRQGLEAVNTVKRIYDFNPTLGGPIVEDRLWFYGGYRYLVTEQYQAGAFVNRNPTAPQYCRTVGGCLYLGKLVPDSRDLDQQAVGGDRFNRAETMNLTWQASSKHKVNIYAHTNQRYLMNASGVNISPEATTFLTAKPDYIVQAHWSNPQTSRLLFEGGFTFYNETWIFHPIETNINGYGPDAVISKLENSVNTRYGSGLTFTSAYNHQYNMRFAANYVTGTHAFKFGVQDMWGTRSYRYDTNQAQAWTFLNGAPRSITQYARPLTDLQRLKAALGLYVQDRWSIKNVTLNLGLRFDYHNAYVPAQDVPALLFVQARQYDALNDAPNWKDLSPRIGGAWDIFGTGKTVLRANYGKYVASESTATATANNYQNTSINSATRSWTDDNGNFRPDCDLASAAVNGECGRLSAPLGALNIVTKWDPAILSGYGVRPDDAEILVGVQQELMERVMLDAQFTRHWFGNFLATQSRATPPSAFDAFCITAPTDSRLPNGGGNQICGFTDVNQTYFGVVPDNLVTKASNFGDVSDVYTGLDVTVTARLARGGVVSGGVSTGRQVTDICDMIGEANVGSNAVSSAGNIGGTNIASFPSSLYCRVEPPYLADVKALVSYPLPWWGLSASATLQNRQGPQVLASYVVNSSQTTLGRPLSVGTATTNLIAPGTEYGDRVNQLDVRIAKALNAGRARIRTTMDIFNVFNTNATLTWNTRHGPSWLTPTQIMQGRLIKFGAQLDF
jgi:hypothetical protein